MNATIILGILSTLLGATSFWSLFMYRKQKERSQDAEAFGKEVVALKSTIDAMQSTIEFNTKRIEELQKIIHEQDLTLRQMRENSSVLEVKHAKNKTAINKAYACTFCPNSSQCPVLTQKAKNEDEYTEWLKEKNLQEKNEVK